MSLRHENHVDTYDPIDVYLPTRLKEKLKLYKEQGGISMSRLVVLLLDKYFRGEIQINVVQPTRVNSYRRAEK